MSGFFRHAPNASCCVPALACLVLAMGCGRADPPASLNAASASPSLRDAASSPARGQAPPGGAAADIEAFVSGPGRDAWYGVYLEGAKVGHGRIRYRRAAEGEVGSYVMVTDMVMKVLGGAEMRLEETRHYDGPPGFGLVRARLDSRASGLVDVRVAKVIDGAWTMERSLNGAAQPARPLPPTRDTLAALGVTNPVDPSGLEVGRTHEVYTWDWERYADDHVTVRVAAVERRRRAGVDLPVVVLSQRSHDSGVTMESIVGQGGAVLEMSLGAGLKLLREEASVAQSDVTGLDILGSGVKVDRALGDPGTVERLVLRARLPQGYALPTAPNQRLEAPAAGGATSTITLTRGAGAEVSAAARAEALKTDPVIDWRAGDVARTAAALTAGVKADREKVRALVRWVYESLDKRLATHLPSASVVLQRGVGDCTEHTWLFTALARAAGVPARPVYGVAYGGDAEQAFAYHAWAEVALDGRWWPVDPTWNQPVADATHLVLGTTLVPVGSVIGGLELEVVEIGRAEAD